MFTKNVSTSFFTEIFCALANFIIGVLLARQLTPDDRGIMVLVMSFPMLLFNFINFGLHEATIYFIGRKRTPPETVLANAISIALAVSGLVFIILAAFSRSILPYFLKGAPANLWNAIILVIPVVFLQSVLLSILRAELKFTLLNAWRALSVLVLLIGFVIVLIGYNGGLNASILVFVCSSGVMLLLAFLILSRTVRIRLRADLDLMQGMVRYGMKSYLQTLLESMNYRFDVYLVAFFLTSDQVAFYGVAFSIAEVAWYLPNSISSVLFPTLAKASLEDIHNITARVNRLTLALTAIVTCAIAAIMIPFIPMLYGSQYQASIPPLLILLPGIVAMSVYKILRRNFASQNRQQFTVLASLISLVIIIALNILLIPLIGIRGSALASTIGYFFSGLVLLIFFLRNSKLTFMDVMVFKRSDIQDFWHKIQQILQSWHKDPST
jgi:O-antigen/teichoic acid export membrane protein